MSEDFRFAHLPVGGKRVFRLGLAGNYGVETADVLYAAERDVNYWLWGRTFKRMTPALREILQGDRDKHVVAVLGNAFLAGGVRRSIERALTRLGTDYLDIFKLGWVGRGSRLSASTTQALLKARQEGLIRSLGCSIHDRPRAGALVRESELDTFMIRYNAKHPGAEQDIFPHLETRRPNVVAYTATSWGQLLKPYDKVPLPPYPGAREGGSPPPLTPGHCYRFCLTSPHVHVVLTGPKTRAQLEENLACMRQGPLTQPERQWVLDYGAFVKSKNRFTYF